MTSIKNLKLIIEIVDTDTDKVLWTDWCTGAVDYQRGMFEEGEMILGKMERHLPMVLERDYPEAELEPIFEPDRGPEDNEGGNISKEGDTDFSVKEGDEK